MGFVQALDLRGTRIAEALKRGRDASDERVIESLYQQALAGNVGAICFWLKNRRPSEWRDVQNINADVGHYIISDRPMSEQQWIEERTKVIEAKPTDATVDRAAHEAGFPSGDRR